MKKIIILSGKQLSGKDAVTKILLETLTDFKRIGLGDAIKLEYSENTGLSLEEIETNKATYRPDLIALGNKRRAEDIDYWIKKVINQPCNIIVSDVRMKREYELFSAAGAYKIRVESSLEARKSRGTLINENDKTETDLDGIKDWNYVIYNNNSLEELHAAVFNLISDIKACYL